MSERKIASVEVSLWEDGEQEYIKSIMKDDDMTITRLSLLIAETERLKLALIQRLHNCQVELEAGDD